MRSPGTPPRGTKRIRMKPLPNYAIHERQSKAARWDRSLVSPAAQPAVNR